MNTNKNNKFLVLIIIALLLGNIFQLFLAGRGKPMHGQKRNMQSPLTEFVEKELNFSAAQMEKFKALKDNKHATDSIFFDKLRAEKKILYQQLGRAKFSDTAINQLLLNAGTNHLSIEKNLISSLKEVRAICTPQQVAIFDTGFYRPLTRPRRNK